MDEEFVSARDGRQAVADMTRLDPIIYTLDNRYYRIGEPIGTGYTVGKGYRNEP